MLNGDEEDGEGQEIVRNYRFDNVIMTPSDNTIMCTTTGSVTTTSCYSNSDGIYNNDDDDDDNDEYMYDPEEQQQKQDNFWETFQKQTTMTYGSDSNNSCNDISSDKSKNKKEPSLTIRTKKKTTKTKSTRGTNNNRKWMLRTDRIVLDLLILVVTGIVLGSITFLILRSRTAAEARAGAPKHAGGTSDTNRVSSSSSNIVGSEEGSIVESKARNGFIITDEVDKASAKTTATVPKNNNGERDETDTSSSTHNNVRSEDIIGSKARNAFITPTTTAAAINNDDDSTVDIWDIQSFVNTKLKSGEKYIKLPTGRHYVQPSKWGVHLRLSNLADVTIDGRDTELICTRTTRAITVSNCHNTKLVGLKIDYDPLPYTQGVIIDMSEDKLILHIEIMSGYPYPGGNNYNTNNNNNIDEYNNTEDGAWDTHKVEIYSPSLNDELATATYYGATFEEEDARNDSSASSSSMRKVITVRKKPSDYPAYDLESIGDIAVIGFRNVEKMIHHAVLVEDSVDTVIDGVTVYASNKFAFFEKDSQNSMYSNNVVDRRPIDEDYYATTTIHTTKQRSYRRLRSANADGFHSKHGKAPSYVNCTARYNGDDGIAINGHYHIITKIVETTPDASVPGGGTTKIRIVPSMGVQPKNLFVGDAVELVRYDRKRTDKDDDGTITTITDIVLNDDPEHMHLHQYEKDFLNNQVLDGIVGSMTRAAPRAYYVVLNQLFTRGELPLGSLIASKDRQGNHFVIRNCTLGPTRSRGIVAKGSHGVITGNTISDTWGQGIMLAPMYNWLESGSGNHLSITQNHIHRAHDVAIAVYAYTGDFYYAPVGAHNNVTIARNVITDSSMPAIAVTSTKKLTVAQNTIDGFNNRYLLPDFSSLFGRNEGEKPFWRQMYLKNVEME